MPTVIGHHDVKDKDHWLASPKREEFFGPLGVTNIRTFVDPTNPTRVAVLMDVADMDALKAAMETPGAAEAMAYDGVVPMTPDAERREHSAIRIRVTSLPRSRYAFGRARGLSRNIRRSARQSQFTW